MPMTKTPPIVLETGGLGKICTKCLLPLPLASFGSGGKGRLNSWCKICKRQSVVERIAVQGYPESKKIQDQRWRDRNKAKICQYRAENRDRANELKRIHYQENPQKVLSVVNRWRRKNPEKVSQSRYKSIAKKPEKYRAIARAAASRRRAITRECTGVFTGAEWLTLCESFGDRCLKCGATGKLEADHVIPLSKGGPNTIDNIQPLCIHCNRTKSAKHQDYRKGFIADSESAHVRRHPACGFRVRQ